MRKSIIVSCSILLIVIGFLAGYLFAKTVRPAYYHLTILNVSPDEAGFDADEIFFEITREGKPEDLIYSYINSERLSMVTQVASWTYKLDSIKGKALLEQLYQDALSKGKRAIYVNISEKDPESLEAVSTDQ